MKKLIKRLLMKQIKIYSHGTVKSDNYAICFFGMCIKDYYKDLESAKKDLNNFEFCNNIITLENIIEAIKYRFNKDEIFEEHKKEINI